MVISCESATSNASSLPFEVCSETMLRIWPNWASMSVDYYRPHPETNNTARRPPLPQSVPSSIQRRVTTIMDLVPRSSITTPCPANLDIICSTTTTTIAYHLRCPWMVERPAFSQNFSRPQSVWVSRKQHNMVIRYIFCKFIHKPIQV